ncbi:MAG: NAD(P)/FAD-dependent oxidoreductase [Pseudomonadota bacterium]
MSTKQRVVIVGGGFAGLCCAKGLAGAPVDITLIDQRNHHLFQPLLYQVATTILPTSEIAWPLRRLFAKRKEVTTLMATVTGVDREAREVICADGTRTPFDTLLLATGARHSYFGKDEWETYAPGLKTLEDATTIRRRILSAFEMAENATDEAERKALQTFVIIGAGPTGVELAGIIAELAHKVLPEEFRHIDTEKSRVLLVEAGNRVLPGFPEKLSTYTHDALAKLGVEVKTGHPVTHVDEAGIILNDEHTPAKTTLWAAGVRASKASKWLRADADRAGRVMVTQTLTLPDDDRIFIAGDTAHVEDRSGKQVPGIAPAAKQQGVYIAKVIKKRLNGETSVAPFKYRHQGNLATIGPRAAVVDFGRVQFTGSIAWWIWGIAHVYFLIGTRSRIAVALSWLYSFISGQNSARLITQGPRDPSTGALTPEVGRVSRMETPQAAE